MEMDTVLAALRAVAEPTRLRLLALCASTELTVSELTQILGQSQPRVSRHLKVLCDAGLLDRSREGTSAFFRLNRRGHAAALATTLSGIVAGDGASDPLAARDRERLERVKKTRAAAAATYFRDNAALWDQIRSLHVDEEVVERVLLDQLGHEPIGDLLDIGTGTGRVLEIVAARVETATGIDLSREMLAVARARLERAGLTNCSVRHGDMYRLPWPAKAFDAVTIHQVLHYADAPAEAVREAARVLRPGGRLVIVDFAPHELTHLRDRQAHRHLGFSDADMIQWLRDAGLDVEAPVHLKGAPLTVTVWAGRHPGEAERGRAARSPEVRSPEPRRTEAAQGRTGGDRQTAPVQSRQTEGQQR
ncbi:MAG: metalloregulator ArsR/SmtB family transcription factor [Alphaproteobacteria bacterium]